MTAAGLKQWPTSHCATCPPHLWDQQPSRQSQSDGGPLLQHRRLFARLSQNMLTMWVSARIAVLLASRRIEYTSSCTSFLIARHRGHARRWVLVYLEVSFLLLWSRKTIDDERVAGAPIQWRSACFSLRGTSRFFSCCKHAIFCHLTILKIAQGRILSPWMCFGDAQLVTANALGWPWWRRRYWDC